MKKFDDQKIIEAVKKDTNYQIKTSSADILRKYRSEIAEPVKEKHTKRNFFVFGGVGVTLVTAAALLAVVFTSSNNDNSNNGGSILPNPTIKNASFQEQLAAFSAFNDIKDDQTLKSLFKVKKANTLEESEDENDESESENKISKETFEDICSTYHEIDTSLSELNKETELKGSVFNKEIKGNKYTYINELYYKGELKPFAKMYFNDEELVTEEEGENEFQALYEHDDKFYSLTIEKEIEIEQDEKEIEYILKFKGMDNNHSYEIKKENEFEGVESESCYSYKDYSDGNFNNLIYELTYKFEKEGSEEEFEVQILKDKKEYLFENIIEKENIVTFVAELEVINGDKLAEGIEVKGQKENNKTTYTYEDLTYIL